MDPLGKTGAGGNGVEKTKPYINATVFLSESSLRRMKLMKEILPKKVSVTIEFLGPPVCL